MCIPSQFSGYQWPNGLISSFQPREQQQLGVSYAQLHKETMPAGITNWAMKCHHKTAVSHFWCTTIAPWLPSAVQNYSTSRPCCPTPPPSLWGLRGCGYPISWNGVGPVTILAIHPAPPPQSSASKGVCSLRKIRLLTAACVTELVGRHRGVSRKMAAAELTYSGLLVDETASEGASHWNTIWQGARGGGGGGGEAEQEGCEGGELEEEGTVRGRWASLDSSEKYGVLNLLTAVTRCQLSNRGSRRHFLEKRTPSSMWLHSRVFQKTWKYKNVTGSSIIWWGLMSKLQISMSSSKDCTRTDY